jgi:hypothetical protein
LFDIFTLFFNVSKPNFNILNQLIPLNGKLNAQYFTTSAFFFKSDLLNLTALIKLIILSIRKQFIEIHNRMFHIIYHIL